MLNSYRDLIVWQKGIELVMEIYRATDLLPKTEQYGLAAQMRRAAVSIPSNIAEGYTRKHRQEYLQFVRIAFGSGAELQTQLIIAKKLYPSLGNAAARAALLLEEVMRMLYKLSCSLDSKS